MATVGAYEAKTHLSKLLERVSKGEKITITRHGVAVAVLIPPEHGATVSPEETIRELRKFRKQHTLGNISIRQLIEEGRK